MAVEIGHAVRGVIVQLMVGLQALPGHVRDALGLAAGDVADRRAGEGGAQAVGIGRARDVAGALHLGIDRALDAQLVVRVGEAIAPGLLAVDALVRDDRRMQAAVGVVVRVAEQLRLGEAADRVGRVQRARHGVHVGVVGLVAEVEEQGLGRVFLRAVERGVLEDVRQARVVDRAREEGQVEHAVGVVVGDVHQLRAGALVLEVHDLRADEREIAQLFDDKALDLVADLGQLRAGGAARRAAGGRREEHGERQQQAKKSFHVSHFSFCAARKAARGI